MKNSIEEYLPEEESTVLFQVKVPASKMELFNIIKEKHGVTSKALLLAMMDRLIKEELPSKRKRRKQA